MPLGAPYIMLAGLPDLKVERITSGTVNHIKNQIVWGTSTPSEVEYNSPGMIWPDYRDDSDRPLGAMGWCVEKQESWTSEDPSRDLRNSKFQIDNYDLGFQHMEPVLVSKSDLSLDMYSALDYPRNSSGDVIWKDSDYVVVAVIKIQFKPHTIKVHSYDTRVIKKLASFTRY